MRCNSQDPPRILEDAPLLRCEPEYGAIVCLKCHNGFPLNPIVKHLTSKHRIFNDIYGPVLQSLPREKLAADWEKLIRPANGSALIEGLQVRSGYVCTACNCLTISDETAREHRKCGGQVNRVQLQCWNSGHDSGFWIVSEPTSSVRDSSISAGLFLFLVF